MLLAFVQSLKIALKCFEYSLIKVFTMKRFNSIGLKNHRCMPLSLVKFARRWPKRVTLKSLSRAQRSSQNVAFDIAYGLDAKTGLLLNPLLVQSH